MEWAPSVLLASVFIVSTALLGPSEALLAVGVTVAGVFGWTAGRTYQKGLSARERLCEYLVTFTGWAERQLAQAPDELDGESERLRQALQSDYHVAQKLLKRLQR